MINIIQECFRASYLVVGARIVEPSKYSVDLIKSIVNGIKVCTIMLINFILVAYLRRDLFFLKFDTDENGLKTINGREFQDWIINEFPQLFFGLHVWFLNRLKVLKELLLNSFYDLK